MIERLKKAAINTNTVKSASVIMIATLFLSNVLGLVRDHLLAQKIPTAMLDTYYAAFRIPDLLFNVLILGAVSSAFIPVLSQYFHKDEKEAWEVSNDMVNFSMICLVAFAIIIVLLMPLLIPLIVPSFNPERQHLTTQLAQLLMIQPIFFGASYLFSGILTARKRFIVYAIAPLVYNSSIIIATFFFGVRYTVHAVILGVIVGAFLHFLIQLITARAIGYKWMPTLNLKHPALKRIALLMLPRSIGLGGMQFVLLIFTAIASSLASGSIAIYTLADNIRTMPLAVFAISFATALFPTLSDSYAAKDERTFSMYMVQGIRSIAFLNIPSAIGMYLLRAQIIRLILGSGYFNWDSTVAASSTLGLFCFGLIGEGFVQLFSRAFYARHNTAIPTAIALISYAIMAGFGFIFSRTLGVSGLALGFSMGISFQMITLMVILWRQLPTLQSQSGALITYLLKLALAVGALVAAVQATKYGSVAIGADMTRTWGVLMQTAVAIIAGSLAYFAVAYAFSIPELASAWKIVGGKLFGSAQRSAND